jgi:di/tricarboxylate transporter
MSDGDIIAVVILALMLAALFGIVIHSQRTMMNRSDDVTMGLTGALVGMTEAIHELTKHIGQIDCGPHNRKKEL